MIGMIGMIGIICMIGMIGMIRHDMMGSVIRHVQVFY